MGCARRSRPGAMRRPGRWRGRAAAGWAGRAPTRRSTGVSAGRLTAVRAGPLQPGVLMGRGAPARPGGARAAGPPHPGRAGRRRRPLARVTGEHGDPARASLYGAGWMLDVAQGLYPLATGQSGPNQARPVGPGQAWPRTPRRSSGRSATGATPRLSRRPAAGDFAAGLARRDFALQRRA